MLLYLKMPRSKRWKLSQAMSEVRKKRRADMSEAGTLPKTTRCDPQRTHGEAGILSKTTHCDPQRTHGVTCDPQRTHRDQNFKTQNESVQKICKNEFVQNTCENKSVQTICDKESVRTSSKKESVRTSCQKETVRTFVEKNLDEQSKCASIITQVAQTASKVSAQTENRTNVQGKSQHNAFNTNENARYTVQNANMLHAPRQIPDKTLGNLSQSDIRFCSESSGRQCTCNALMFLLFSKVIDTQYTAAMLDEILIRGDNLYKSVVQRLKLQEKFKSYLLEISELPSVVLNSISYTIDKFDMYVGTIRREQHSPFVYTLTSAVTVTLRNSEFALVMAGAICSAIRREGDEFLFFDSHSHGTDMMPSSNGYSLLASFSTVENLITYMESFYSNLGISPYTRFEVQSVVIGTQAAICLSPKTVDARKTLTSDKSSTTLDNMRKYFESQNEICAKNQILCKEPTLNKTHKKWQVKTSRKVYLKEYKRKQRTDKAYKVHEKLYDKERKQTRRNVPELKEQEQASDRQRKEIKRCIQQNREKEQASDKQRKEVKRCIPQNREKEQASERQRKKVKRCIEQNREKEQTSDRQKKGMKSFPEIKKREASIKAKSRSKLDIKRKEQIFDRKRKEIVQK